MRNEQEQAWWGSFPGDPGAVVHLDRRAAGLGHLSVPASWPGLLAPCLLLVVAALTCQGPQDGRKACLQDVPMAQGVGTRLPMQGMQVRSLVWELRSHTQWGPGTTMKILQATTKTQIKK